MIAVTLDMSKAYDRVEWSFLKMMMNTMGFAPVWTSFIMKCVWSTSYQGKVNK